MKSPWAVNQPNKIHLHRFMRSLLVVDVGVADHARRPGLAHPRAADRGPPPAPGLQVGHALFRVAVQDQYHVQEAAAVQLHDHVVMQAVRVL